MSYANSFSITKEMTDFVAKDVREMCIAIDAGVVLQTPVDTGRAKGNWIVSVDYPNNSKNEFEGTKSQAEQFSISAGKEQIAKVKGFGLVYIQNNLDYINKLNNGWSLQAPTKFIEKVIEIVVNASK